MYFFIGLTVFGVFGSFTYYLPELFPTRLRGTGAGFCYNVGRIVAAAGPFLVGTIAARGTDALGTAMHLLFFVGIVPIVGVLLPPLGRRDQGPRAGLDGRLALADHVLQQVDAAVAVAPLVVVPADQLEEVRCSARSPLPASKMLECASWMKSLETTSSSV